MVENIHYIPEKKFRCHHCNTLLVRYPGLSLQLAYDLAITTIAEQDEEIARLKDEPACVNCHIALDKEIADLREQLIIAQRKLDKEATDGK